MQSLNTSTSFPCQQCCQVTTSRQVSNVTMRGEAPNTRQEDSKFFSFQGLPRASGCMTVLSLQNTMTAKDGDMGIRAYAVHMQFHWTAVGGRVKGVIKILQINYTKKKRQIYIRNLYKAFTSPSSFVQTLQRRKKYSN